MDATAPLIVAAIAAMACGLGGCAVAHRMLNRGTRAGAHCGASSTQENRLSRLPAILASALLCGLVMAVVLAVLPKQ